MRALLWKEFRENLKWGIALFVASAVAHVLLQVESYPYFALYCEEYFFLGLFGFLGAAFGLGLLQVAFEAPRDRFAFLMHRAVSPRQIVAAKVAAGLTYYSLAILIPLFILAVWSSLPGRVPAVWDWRAPLGGLAVWLAASGGWAAGVLVGLRPVRWYGSRILPLGLPILATVLSMVTMAIEGPRGFWLAIVIAIVEWAVLIPPTLAVFGSRGDELHHSTIARWGLGFASLCGVALLVGTAAALAAETIAQFTGRMPTNFVRYGFSIDGRLGRQAFRSGEPLAHLEWVDSAAAGTEPEPGRPFAVLERVYGSRPDEPQQFFRRTGPVEQAQGIARTTQHQWYFDAAEGAFLGFDTRTCLLDLRITPSGIRPAAQPATDRFQAMARISVQQPTVQTSAHELFQLNWRAPQAFSDGVYLIDEPPGAVTKVYSAPPDDPLLGLVIGDWGRGNEPSPPAVEQLVVRALHQKSIREYVLLDGDMIHATTARDGFIHVTDDLPHRVVPLPDALQGWTWLQYGRLADGRVVYEVDGYPHSLFEVRESHLLIADAGGQVLRHVLSDQAIIESPHLLTHAVIPPFLHMIPMVGIGIERRMTLSHAGVTIEDYRTHPQVLLMICINVVGVALSIISVWLLARRWQVSNRAATCWSIVCLLTGVSGLLTFIAVQPRAGLVACPACGNRRRVDSAECPACQSEFPAPAREGTELILC